MLLRFKLFTLKSLRDIFCFIVLLTICCDSYALINSKKKTVVDNSYVYKVAVDPFLPPLSFIDANGDFRGFEIALLNEISKRANIKFKFVPMNFDGIMQNILDEKVDCVLSSLSITEERKQYLDFSDPYYTTKIVLLTRGDINIISEAENFYELKNVHIGVKSNTLANTLANKYKESRNLEISQYDYRYNAIISVINRTIDGFIDDYVALKYSLNFTENINFLDIHDLDLTTDYGFAVKKGKHQDLLICFNKYLKEMEEDGTLSNLRYNLISNKKIK